MDTNAIEELRLKFQEIIDLIAHKNAADAQVKLTEASESVDDLIDFAKSDKELQELSPFQVLTKHLQLKIDILKTSLN